MFEELSEKEYWDMHYRGEVKVPLEVEGFRHLTRAKLYESLRLLNLDGKRVLEIGAGDSSWLTFLARKHPSCVFVGLDYAPHGCEQLKQRAEGEGVEVGVVCGDLFDPPEDMLGAFDVVLSFGVVEHFESLPNVLQHVKKFAKPGGQIYSEIPNMSGLNGWLSIWLEKSVYDIHNPHNLKGLVEGHQQAGLEVKHSAYMRSNDLTFISSCISEKTSWIKRAAYHFLEKVTLVLSLVECNLFALPKSGLFSPFLFCIADVPVKVSEAEDVT